MLAILVQPVADPTGGWGSLLEAHGPSGLAIALLMWICRTIWVEYQKVRGENKQMQDAMVKETMPLLIRTQDVLKEAIESQKSSVSKREFEDLRNEIVGLRSEIRRLK